MDSYQAIYDAVRSKISNGDISEAIKSVLRESNLEHYAEMARLDFAELTTEQQRPSALFRPKVFIDGNKWCALYGENIQDGVAGFGNSPSDAMHAFDKEWHTNLAH